MNRKTILDLHVHTDNSFDGNYSTMLLCETAIKKGLRAIAFTDHCEVDSYFVDNYERSVRQAFFEAAKARSAFTGRLLVLQGIELAQPTYDKELAEKIIATYNYDIIIGSIHNLRGQPDFYFMKSFEGIDIDDILKQYFDELILLAEWNGFDTMAHLTYPFRYLYSRASISVDINKYKKQVDEVLKLLAENRKALEINTGGLRQPIKKLSPEFETIKRFKQLGGEFVTIGSDAHYADHLATGLTEAVDAASEAGFKYITLYQNRLPFQIPIE